jgi:hypothetical protein
MPNLFAMVSVDIANSLAFHHYLNSELVLLVLQVAIKMGAGFPMQLSSSMSQDELLNCLFVITLSRY